jgi:hypothetical protein
MLGDIIIGPSDQQTRLAAPKDEEAFKPFLDLKFHSIGTMQNLD